MTRPTRASRLDSRGTNGLRAGSVSPMVRSRSSRCSTVKYSLTLPRLGGLTEAGLFAVTFVCSVVGSVAFTGDGRAAFRGKSPFLCGASAKSTVLSASSAFSSASTSLITSNAGRVLGFLAAGGAERRRAEKGAMGRLSWVVLRTRRERLDGPACGIGQVDKDGCTV
jgi:hypothetical protein